MEHKSKSKMRYRDKPAYYLESMREVFSQIDEEEIQEAAKLLLKAYEEGSQVFVFGNGGSGSTASHLACDLNKGCGYGRSKRFKVICLNDNTPTLMAYSNDVGYDVVFLEQLKNFLREGDLVIGFSGSGNSVNVLKAIEYANKNNAVTLGFTGYDGGRLKETAGYSIHVPVMDMQKAEDTHLIIGHIIMQLLCDELGLTY